MREGVSFFDSSLNNRREQGWLESGEEDTRSWLARLLVLNGDDSDNGGDVDDGSSIRVENLTALIIEKRGWSIFPKRAPIVASPD